MAKKPKIKVTKTFDYGKLSTMLPKVISDGLNLKMVGINRGIQEGLEKGVDIDGKAFAPLGFRALNTKQNDQILVETGKMKQTRLSKSTPSKLQASITSKAKYGIEHNEGRPEERLPQRKWFGVNKDNKPGGKESQKVDVFYAVKLRNAWKK